MRDTSSKSDPNSYSIPEQCVITDIKLNLEVNFQKKILSGYVDISVERKNPKANLILDTRNLVIENIRNKNTMKKINYVLGDDHEVFGSQLEIKLPKTNTKKFNIRIDYETSPRASALTWLDSIQTAGKKQPYLFSSCQPIHARSLLPCQDTPSVKVPYSATIVAPFDLVVLMSAINDGDEMDSDPLMKKFKFIQKNPVPSYLIAIAVGALESRRIGPRSHVWCEKEYIERAAAEFSETEKMISTAEELLGPYVWEVYDLLVLPPCYSYGGMENPCVTFVTPSILAGDKSLVDVIVHEIAHSWTGNLVTNSSFEHVWLNEGFTQFIERKIIGKLRGEPLRHALALGGWKDMQYSVEVMGENNPLTKLVPDLTDTDPDDGFTTVQYEKGHTLLFYLEEKLGSVEFEKFLRDYIEKHKYQALNTDDWLAYFNDYFLEKKDILDEVDWQAWLYTPGMPPVKPKFDKSCAEDCARLCRAWTCASDNCLNEFAPCDVEAMTSNQIKELVALLMLEVPLSVTKVEKMNDVYKMNERNNSEIRSRWIRLAIKARWKTILPEAVKFVSEYGRIKFIRPIYRDLFKWDESRELAISTFNQNITFMMADAVDIIAKDLQLDSVKK